MYRIGSMEFLIFCLLLYYTLDFGSWILVWIEVYPIGYMPGALSGCLGGLKKGGPD
jgi:hypothetical protein